MPLIYHLDVAAMYPNIILTNRLQPSSIVTGAPGCTRTQTAWWQGAAQAVAVAALRASVHGLRCSRHLPHIASVSPSTLPARQTRTALPATSTAPARHACARWNGCGVARRIQVGVVLNFRRWVPADWILCALLLLAAMACQYPACTPPLHSNSPSTAAATRAEYASLKAQLQSETFPPATPDGPQRLWTDLQQVGEGGARSTGLVSRLPAGAEQLCWGVLLSWL